MYIDTTQLMYRVFLSCRHALSTTASDLSLLIEVLDIVKQQNTFLVDVPDAWVVNHELQHIVIALENPSQPDYAITTDNQPLFALIDQGAHELQALWASESKHAVRSLGYAFHMLPRLLCTPERFRPDLYMFNFRIVSFNWSKLSQEMQQAFSNVMGFDLEKATALANSEGFSMNMWGTRPPQ